MTPISLPLLVLAAILGPGLSGQRGGNASSCRIPVGAWFDPATGAIVNDPIARLARHSVVLLGETHDAAEHHRWQWRVLLAAPFILFMRARPNWNALTMQGCAEPWVASSLQDRWH